MISDSLVIDNNARTQKAASNSLNNASFNLDRSSEMYATLKYYSHASTVCRIIKDPEDLFLAKASSCAKFRWVYRNVWYAHFSGTMLPYVKSYSAIDVLIVKWHNAQKSWLMSCVSFLTTQRYCRWCILVELELYRKNFSPDIRITPDRDVWHK